MFRIGIGYDVHKLVSGYKLIIGGVDIPFEKGLKGHSDGDVLTHAICDAILGCLNLGDIGEHFPDTDERFNGISSLKLLGNVMEMMNKLEYKIVNIDSTIIAQRPKLLPYKDQMKCNISETLRINKDKVNVKATTTEGLGFEGKGEGIAAQAIALCRRI